MSDRLFQCHDLLLLIAEHLSPNSNVDEYPSYANLLSFSLVNKHFLAAGRHAIYREITLPLENLDAAWLFVRTLESLDSSVAAGVRVVDWFNSRLGPRSMARVQAACPGIISLKVDSLQFVEYCSGDILPVLQEIHLCGFNYGWEAAVFKPLTIKTARFLSNVKCITFQSIDLGWSGPHALPIASATLSSNPAVNSLHFIGCGITGGFVRGIMGHWGSSITRIVLEDLDLDDEDSMDIESAARQVHGLAESPVMFEGHSPDPKDHTWQRHFLQEWLRPLFPHSSGAAIRPSGVRGLSSTRGHSSQPRQAPSTLRAFWQYPPHTSPTESGILAETRKLP